MKIVKMLVLGLCLSQFASAFTTTDRIAIGEELIQLFRYHYGPMQYKIDRGMLDLPAEELRLRTAMRDVGSDLLMYAAMKRFVGSFKDAHVMLTLPSTYVASVGFDVDVFGDRVIITNIFRSRLSEEVFPFDVGDEVIAVDGIPVLEVLRSLAVFNESGRDQVNLQIASEGLTYRKQSMYVYVPEGESTWTIHSQSRATDEKVNLAWEHDGYPLRDSLSPLSVTPAKMIAQLLSPRKDTEERATAIGANLESPLADVRRKFGRKMPLFDLGAQFVQRSDGPIVTGVFVRGASRIGFLRLRKWNYTGHDMQEDDVMEFLQQELSHLNATTDALLIDQTMNPGGSACLVEKVLSLFIEHPEPVARFQMRATGQRLLDYERHLMQLDNVMQSTPEDKASYRLWKSYVDELRDSIHVGRRLTRPIGVCRSEPTIAPAGGNRAVYSRPVLLMTDAQSCSGGDLFPVMMQAAGHQVFGEQTLGCGGSVLKHENWSSADLFLKVTDSLMWRPTPAILPDGSETYHVENIGAIPDVPYELGYDDYLDGYATFRETALRELEALAGLGVITCVDETGIGCLGQ